MLGLGDDSVTVARYPVMIVTQSRWTHPDRQECARRMSRPRPAGALQGLPGRAKTMPIQSRDSLHV